VHAFLIHRVPTQPWETGGQAGGAAARGQPLSGQRTMGFGLAGRPSGGGLTVVNVVPGSSAERVGLKAGDQLVELDGTAAASMSPVVVRTAVSRGGPVKVVVLREGRRLEFTVEPYVVP
jgi:carboxyl-terminal processing protease